MELREIIEQWDEDSDIGADLAFESLRIPKLHHKYYKILMGEKMRLKKLELDRDELFVALKSYFNGQATKEDLIRFNLPQWQGKILLKEDVSIHMNTIPLYQEFIMKYSAQLEKVEFLKEIIKTLNARGYLLHNAIEIRKFENR